MRWIRSARTRSQLDRGQAALFKDRLVNRVLTGQAGQKSGPVQITLDNRIELPQVGAVQDIVAKFAGENGLKTAVSESLKAYFYGYLAQTAESDLNFLTRLALDLDATAKPAGGALVFVKRGEGKAADGTDLPVPVITLAQMSRANWKVTGRGKYGKVIAEWSELGAASVNQVSAGDKEPLLQLRHRHASQGEAQRAADSALQRSKRASGKISIQLAGFIGDLLAEGFVELQGIHPALTGQWLVSQVTHRLGGTLITSFDAERDNDG
ncbi:contractile injection system protein, VgrG/Pvc8 family [Parasedimentitalea psychrophila]|uniref:Contractile injection system protein, VgrG/Pvc8 family n=1 Tax=Parasedimentitalea psychrophila TaxID=2997337 RepID=A0A9Y2P2F2_9RHOB|nr:contractile injection system protein, VgrG/Pvc8 family [Parasedimentitalea psychrophila]WIY25022.1 contractile injection system protein, VgrG/Pvc8 family [Parasedimentitalea psychrophila]